jgi:hypothetical protein
MSPRSPSCWAGLAAGVLLLLLPPPGRADVTGGAGTGTIDLSVAGYGSQGSVGPAAIPRAPGSLFLGTGGPFGTTTGFMAVTWDFTPSSAEVFIPPSPPAPSTTFLSQTIPSFLPGPEPGLATLRADFSVTFVLDASGLGPTTLATAYDLIMIVDGSVAFDVSITFTNSVLGLLDTLDIHFSRTTPGGFGTTVGGSASLPAQPGGSTFTAEGFFQLQVDDNPGGSSTEIDVFHSAVPEPTSMLLAGLGALSLLLPAARRNKCLV